MTQVKVVTRPPRVRRYQLIMDQVEALKPTKALEVPVKGWDDDRRLRFKVGLRIEARRRKQSIHIFTGEDKLYIYK